MNAMHAILTPLPLPTCLLGPPDAGRHRRHRIGTVDLTAAAVDRFNRLLERLGRADPPLDPDRLVTAARELCSCEFATVPPACIRQRLRRVKAAVCMVEDREWSAPDEAAVTVRVVADYVAGHDDLIPDATPTVGRLDDAIVIDAAWPALDTELTSYLDFRRLRRYLMPHAAQVHFDRAAWQQARREEEALLAHCRQVRERSYYVAQAPLFAIH